VAAAAAVGVGGASAQDGNGGKGFKAVTINHISYQVKDYRVTRDFYADLLGMGIKQDNGRNQCYMTFGDSFLLPRNAREGSTLVPRVDHIAYTIENWDKDKVEAELKRRKLAFPPSHPDGPRPDTENSFHVKDPDGFDLQISGKDMKA